MNRVQRGVFLKSRRNFLKDSFILINFIGLGSLLFSPLYKNSYVNKFPRVTHKNGWMLLSSDIDK